MIDLSQLAERVNANAAAVGFEGKWHAIEFQPELTVPQYFVIGVAVSMRGKLVGYRVAEEAARLKCFYGDMFGKEVWGWLRGELIDELERLKGERLAQYESKSPQLRLGAGHYVSGLDASAVLSRAFERVVTVTGGDKKPRAQGISQITLRQQIARMLKLKLNTRYEGISQPESGLPIRDGDVIHTFDISYDDTVTASSVVSACYASIDNAKLNVLAALNDLETFNRIRKRNQIGLAILTPSQDVLPLSNVRAWSSWWSETSYKLRESNFVLLAESDSPERLAEHVADWYPDAQ